MIANYIKIAIRSLRRRPNYTFLNMAGLSIGFTCCILIALYVRAELLYDRFIPDHNRIYRVALDVQVQELRMRTAYTARPLGPTLLNDFPEVEEATRLWFDPSGNMVVRYGNNVFPEDRVFFADSTFFDVFNLSLHRGDARTALKAPFSIVLTESMAVKYFGDEDPLGKVLHLREPSDRDVFDYRVTGVMADLPRNSHLEADFIASFSTQRQSQSTNWLSFGVYTYLKLREGASPHALESKLPAFFAVHGGPQIQENYGISLDVFEASGNHYTYFLQPLTQIHLHSDLQDEIKPTSDARLISLFALVGVFVVVLACINFVNLSTAHATRRGLEIGIRKTLGSFRGQLVAQFLVEAVIVSLSSLCVSLLIVGSVLPYFSAFTGYAISVPTGNLAAELGLLLLLGIVAGLGAGAYPALYLSGFRPASVLKGRRSRNRPSRLRDTLVVFQFGIATVLIACTAIVYSQTRYMLSKNLGFDPEQVLVIEGAEVMGRQSEAFRQALRAIPTVTSVTNAEQVPGRYFNGSSFKLPEASDASAVVMEYTYASYDYLETLDIDLVAGRSLSRDYATDSLAVILNEEAVRQLGLEDPIGRRLEWPGESTYTIVGVVEDFHIASLHHGVGPVALLGPDPRNTNRPNLLVAARIQSDRWTETVGEIAALWDQFAPQSPFVYSFMDDNFARLYERERRTGRLITLFSVIAILVACFGLFGLAAYTAEQRTKEIGVRKTFGASEISIVTLLSRDFTRLVVLAIVLAVPVAYVIMDRWLSSFAFAIRPGPVLFLGVGLTSLLIAWAAVSTQSIRAARLNPVEALKYE